MYGFYKHSNSLYKHSWGALQAHSRFFKSPLEFSAHTLCLQKHFDDFLNKYHSLYNYRYGFKDFFTPLVSSTNLLRGLQSLFFTVLTSTLMSILHVLMASKTLPWPPHTFSQLLQHLSASYGGVMASKCTLNGNVKHLCTFTPNSGCTYKYFQNYFIFI
jgi:hypothetical protein